MTLIALFAWNCCMILLQLHADIHSADHASFSPWIVVGLYGFFFVVLLVKVSSFTIVLLIWCFVDYRQQMSTMPNCHFYDSKNMRCQVKDLHSYLFSSKFHVLWFKVLVLKYLCVGSVTLNNIIQKNFPEEYAERKSEQDTLVHLGNESMPLFVMDVIIPCQKLSLHIFEPRYRLMVSNWKTSFWISPIFLTLINMWKLKQVRRIMEGNHRMGMVSVVSFFLLLLLHSTFIKRFWLVRVVRSNVNR